MHNFGKCYTDSTKINRPRYNIQFGPVNWIHFWCSMKSNLLHTASKVYPIHWTKLYVIPWIHWFEPNCRCDNYLPWFDLHLDKSPNVHISATFLIQRTSADLRQCVSRPHKMRHFHPAEPWDAYIQNGAQPDLARWFGLRVIHVYANSNQHTWNKYLCLNKS